jgi:hypothetical protein
MIYEFTEEDLELAAKLAHRRNDRKEKLKIRSKKFDPSKSEWDAHYTGILGELGAARALGLPIDTRELLSGDNGIDLEIAGLSIEIRYRTKQGWDFALNGSDVSFLKSDIGILVWPGDYPNSVELVGWTTRIHILSQGEIMNFGYGDRLVLPHSKTLDMSKLQNILNKNLPCKV